MATIEERVLALESQVKVIQDKLGLTVTPTVPTAKLLAGHYNIVSSVNPKFVANVYGGYDTVGASVAAFNTSNANNERFNFKADSGQAGKILAFGDTRALDVDAAGNVVIKAISDAQTQLWTVDASLGTITNYSTSRLMEVSNATPANGVKFVAINKLNGSPTSNQKFTFTVSQASQPNSIVKPPVVSFPPAGKTAAIINSQLEMGVYAKADQLVTDNGKVPPICKFTVVTPSGKTLLETEAFNVGFTALEVGDYQITAKSTDKFGVPQGEQYWLAKVADKKWTVVQDPVDFGKALATATTDTKIVLTRDAETSMNNVVFKGRLVGNGHTVKYTGDGGAKDANGVYKWQVMFLNLDPGASVDGVNYVGPFYDPTQRSRVANFCQCRGSNVVSNSKFSKVAHVVQAENGPVNVAFYNNAVDRFLTNYVMWISGENIFIHNNTAEDSSTEHIFRGSNYRFVSIVNCKLRNQDLRGEGGTEVGNFSKSCINMQGSANPFTQFVYVYNNVCTEGPMSMGPLGIGDVTTVDQRTQYVVFHKNKGIEGLGGRAELQVQHGTDHALILDNDAQVSLRPWYGDDPKLKGRTITDIDLNLKKSQAAWGFDSSHLQGVKVTYTG